MFDKLFRRPGKPPPVEAVEEAVFPETLVEIREDLGTETLTGTAPLTLAVDLDFTYICRAPVVDRSYRVVGYEFMLRGSAVLDAQLADPVTRQLDEQALLSRLVPMDLARLLAYRYTFFAMSAQLLLSPTVEQLPPDLSVLLVRADSFGSHVDPNIAARMTHLRRMGFGFGLQVDEQSMSLVDQLHQLTHYVVLDLSCSEPGRLLDEAVKGLRRWPETQLFIKHVPDVHTFELCNTLLAKYVGIHLFQGDFLVQPLPWRSDHVDTGKTRIVRLLKAIKKSFEIPALAESLRHDPLLLSRLLRYANSAAASPLSKVNSAERALTMMGRENVYRMLTVLLFCSGEVDQRDVSIMDNALVRARFAETLGTGHLPLADCDNLFLVGMFSLLHILLRVPPDEALLPLDLPSEVTEALMGGTGPYAGYLHLVVACEHGDQERIALCAAQCDVSEATVNTCHLEAILWAQEL
ncbi:MAG: HDOD domain-containing protein, partial [Burkholderiaceae bacterium]|nr:HDOD domain-containing protein [Burkholderiaceae bacterium]